MKDTLQTVIGTIDKSTFEGLELINKVDSFYNSAWNKLIIIGTVSFAVIGILVPYVIQWYQKKTLSISESLLKKEIEDHSSKIKSQLLEEINTTFDEKFKEFEQRIEKISSASSAKSFHLQANGHCQKGNIADGLSDFICASFDYLRCQDYPNLRTVLNYIHTNLIPKLSLEEITDLKISQNRDLEELLDEIAKFDKDGIFNDIVGKIKLKLTKLPKTKEEKIKR